MFEVNVVPISNSTGKRFVAQHHYAVICPPITKVSLGLFADGELVGVALWGYGTRPKHTINKIFPSLGVKTISNSTGFACWTRCPGTRRAGSSA